MRKSIVAMMLIGLFCGQRATLGHDDLHPAVFLDVGGRLAYTPDARGNTVPDFSRCGYRGGGVALPEVPVRVTLTPVKGSLDDTERIQAAIDALSTREPDASGFRGALLLKRGLYRIAGSLKLSASGVILRGEGQQEDGTVLLATGTQQRTLIEATGTRTVSEVRGTRQPITDSYVPWGATMVGVESTSGFRVGNRVMVHRPSTAEWIHAIGMDRMVERAGTVQWEPGRYDLCYERTIVAIEENRLRLDAPMVQALDARYGGGTVVVFQEKEAASRMGVEGLRLVSEYVKGNEELDEQHAWLGVSLNVGNSWVRNVTTVHFSHGVSCGRHARFTTVQDCACLKPVSQITGGRRYAFEISGQYCLIQRCYSEESRHAEVTGSRVCGPNVFLDCLAENTHSDAGPHQRWATGVLWDNLKGGAFNAQDRGNYGSGHGWAGALMVFWNCETQSICVQQPPTSQNYAIGCTGKVSAGRFKDRTPGHYESMGQHVAPRSLYLQQLEQRLGTIAVENVTTKAQRNGTIYRVLKEILSN
jgi:hypothetical protein